MKRLTAVLIVLASVAASAYVLPGGSILRRMVGAREDLNLSSMRAEGSLIFSGPAVKEAASALSANPDRPELQGDGVLSLRVPGRCRFEASVPGSTARLATVQVGSKRRAEGPEVATMSALIAQVCPILAAGGGSVQDVRESVEGHLQGLGIDTKRSGLARFGGEVAYVLGDPAEGRPQFWVYKDNFRPARVRYADTSGTLWDVRFLDYTSPSTGEWLPRTIEVWRAGQRTLRFTALKGDNRTALSDRLFAP